MFGRFYLGLLVGLMIAGAPLSADQWREFENLKGNKVEAKILMIMEDEVRIQRRSDGKEFELKIADLVEADREFIREKKNAQEDPGPEGDESGEDADPLYPRTREEIKEMLREIKGRDPINDVSREQQEGVNLLNSYRYLCGVPYDVEATPELVAKADEAAEACKDNGGLSHSIGHFTGKCNLSAQGDRVHSVFRFILDTGEKNRVKRGHRRWCLNSRMRKTGLGASGTYSAMWATNSEGPKAERSWMYPGRGYFPKDMLHGNGWSLYLNRKAPSKDELKVEVYRLTKRPERAFGMDEEIPGRALPVKFVAKWNNAINFEPESDPITSRGIYWVRVSGGGVAESYVVDLY